MFAFHPRIATGRKRSGKRLLTVGTDCALGKKYTALSIARALQERGVQADFRATGQTGILISGSGTPMDAVVADFEAGAAEMLSPDASSDHWDGDCARELLARESRRLGLPVADPVRGGTEFQQLVDACLA
jgi:uncharacterized NAD-dependent epimerase/dehydratase family protein